jgi:hypothetical protein
MQGRYIFIYIQFKKNNFLFSEHVSTAIKREFIEEAMNSNPAGEKNIAKLFETAIPVKKIYFKLFILLNLNRFIKVIWMIQEIRVNILLYIK